MLDRENNAIVDARAACRQFDADLSAYLESEERPGVPRHAGECPFCNAILQDFKQIRAQSLALPLDRPGARVWANIRATLADEGILREPWQVWLGEFLQAAWLRNAAPIGALACLAVLGVSLLFQRTTLAPGDGLVSTPVVAEAGAASPPASEEENALVRTVGEMQKSYTAHEHSLNPALLASYQKGLESLDASIQECRDSIKREPDNALAREYLVAAYTQKAEVLATALEYDER